MNLLRICLKAVSFVMVTVILAPFYFFVLIAFYRWRRLAGPRLVRFYSRICLSIFRVSAEVKNSRAFVKRKGGMLIIANHVCLLDIFLLSSLFGSVFVSKKEVKYYPVIGQIAWLTGVVFFDRRSARERTRVLRTIAYSYWDCILAVFPQGTTGSIAQRLPFNRGIFKVTELNQDITLLPVTLCYKHEDEVSWSRPQSLWENALRLSSQEAIKVKVLVHDPVTIDAYRGKTTAQICGMVEGMVLDPLQKPYREI
jgi:1-acyl-sn-glycerol-3-phosphate acyltransferase